MNGHDPRPVKPCRLRWRVAGASLAISIVLGATAAAAAALTGGVVEKVTSTAETLTPNLPAPKVSADVSVGDTSVSAGTGSTGGSAGGSVSVGSGLASGGVSTGTAGSGSSSPSGSAGTGSTPGSPAGTSVTVTRAGTVTALAPGFAPASGQFRLLEPPAPPATAANLLVPFPVVLIEGSYTPRGVRVRRLSVQAPPGATTRILCIGRRCPRRGMRQGATAAAGPLRAVRFRHFQRRFSAGVSISIYVTKAGKIGKYTRFRVRKGSPPTRTDACVSGTARRSSPCPTA